MSDQLPLALRFRSDQRLDNYLGDRAFDRELLSAIATGRQREWAFLSGPRGSGKTHLLIAACGAAEAAEKHPAFLSLARIDTRFADALAAFDNADLVALDSVDAWAGNRAAEQALFDFHNRARSSSTCVLYAARAAPAALPLTLPDLRSRLAQCAQLPLLPLDETGRRTVLVNRAAARGLILDDAVLDYLFHRVERDLGSLIGLLDRIDHASLAAQRRVTVPFLRSLLACQES